MTVHSHNDKRMKNFSFALSLLGYRGKRAKEAFISWAEGKVGNGRFSKSSIQGHKVMAEVSLCALHFSY